MPVKTKALPKVRPFAPVGGLVSTGNAPAQPVNLGGRITSSQIGVLGPAYGPKARAAPTTGQPQSMQDWLDFFNRQQDEVYRRMLATQQSREDAYRASLLGFGQALQSNAAQAWGDIVGSYGRSAAEANAYAGAFADQFSQGLTDANRDLATSAAGIGSHAPLGTVDPAAAREQIATVGGAKPGETMGLVGKAWGSYGETRPGTIGLMTMQNEMQAHREALQQQEDLTNQFAQMALDNPQKALGMWQAMNEEQRAQAADKLAAAKEAREARAFELQVAQYNRQMRSEMAGEADALSRRTGWVYVYDPKSGRLKNTGQRTQSWIENHQKIDISQQNATTSQQRLTEQQRHNQAMEANAIRRAGISQQQADTARARERRLKAGGYTPAEQRQLANTAQKIAKSVYEGEGKMVKNKDGTYGFLPTKKKGTATQALRQMLAVVPYSIAWRVIYQYASLPNSRWAGALNWNKAPGQQPYGGPH